MSAYLAYLYSINLIDEEKIKIDSQVEKGRKDFGKGFRKGIKVSLSMYSIFLLVKSTATPVYADDVPADTQDFDVQPEPGPAVPAAKPGMKPLNEGVKGAFIGGSSAICGAALQSGDFALGLACAFLLVIGGIVINRPPHK
jgi:hypothetical protein